MGDPVKKSDREYSWLFFEGTCEAPPSSEEETPLFSQPFSTWFNRAESFYQFVPGSQGVLTNLRSSRFSPETLTSFLVEPSRLKYVSVPGIEEYFGRKKHGGADALKEGLDLCFCQDPQIQEGPPTKENVAEARRAFIQNLAVHIVDPGANDRFTAIMEGLLGDEPEEGKWKELYQEYFGCSEEELETLDEHAFTYEEGMAQDLAEDDKVARIISGDPKISGYIGGLISRAQILYGVEDPDFVEEYKEYLELTVNTLGTEGKLEDLDSLQDHLKTPEDYRKKGFLNLPERPKDALSGSEFMEKGLGVDLEEFKKNPRQLGSLSKVDRENAILEQIELGNVPDFLRRPKAVIIKGPNGEEVKTYVMPDYIAIGSNEDFVRVPLSPIIAQALAFKYGLSLPTKTIVEETYLQAGKRVIGPSYSHADEFEENSAYLDSPGFYLRSNQDIQDQLKGVIPGTLVSGGKKELVVSPFVAVRFKGGKADESIAFYGLYDSEGTPIQRTPGHGGESGYRHTEYALGVRFMSPMIVVKNGAGERRVMRMQDALKDPEVAKVISRLERTEDHPKFRALLMDGPFDVNTVYRQNLPKGQKGPRGPSAD